MSQKESSYRILSDNGCYWICLDKTNSRYWAGRSRELTEKMIRDLILYEAEPCHIGDIIEDYLYEYCFCE